MSTEEACLLCGLTARFVGRFENPIWRAYICDGCGAYAIDAQLETELQGEEAKDTRFRLACVVREMRGRGNKGQIAIASRGVPEDADLRRQFSAVVTKDELVAQFPSATEIIDRALLNLSRLVKHPMEEKLYKDEELAYLLFCPMKYLLVNQLPFMQQMELLQYRDYSRTESAVTITPAGWKRVYELSKTPIDSRQAFVAMWFTDAMEAFYRDAIEPAVKAAGYDCKRVDLIEHNNKICDEIVAEILKSRFVIADFTGQRAGVYFEAGYGMGMGIPVIWLVRKDEVEKLHFDTRQYNHIVYESVEELRQRLYNRIVATIR